MRREIEAEEMAESTGRLAGRLGLALIFLVAALAWAAPSSLASGTEASLQMGISLGGEESGAADNSTRFIGGPSLGIPVSIDLIDSYPAIAAKRIVGQDLQNSTLQVIAELPVGYTEVLLNLPRAEQDEILRLDPDEAVDRLSRYRLVNRSRYDLYSERYVSSEAIESAQAKLAGAKAENKSILTFIKGILARFGLAQNYRTIDEDTKISRDYLLNTIGIYIRSVEQIKYNAEISDDLTDEEAESIITNAEQSIGKLQEIQLRVMNAVTPSEIDKLKLEVSALGEQLGPAIKSDSLELMRSRLLEIVKRDEQMERKLECTIEGMRQDGIDTAPIEEKFGELSAKVYFAKTDLRNARDLSAAGNFTYAERKTLSAQIKLEEAYYTLKDVVKDIRTMNGTIEECVTVNPEIITTVEEY